MKWLISFLVMGIICSVVYEIIFGLAIMQIEKAVGYHPVLEALQHACAIAIGFFTSYKLWPPKGKRSGGKTTDSANNGVQPTK